MACPSPQKMRARPESPRCPAPHPQPRWCPVRRFHTLKRSWTQSAPPGGLGQNALRRKERRWARTESLLNGCSRTHPRRRLGSRHSATGSTERKRKQPVRDRGGLLDPGGPSTPPSPSGAPEAETHPGALGGLLGVQVLCDLEGQDGGRQDQAAQVGSTPPSARGTPAPAE